MAPRNNIHHIKYCCSYGMLPEGAAVGQQRSSPGLMPGFVCCSSFDGHAVGADRACTTRYIFPSLNEMLLYEKYTTEEFTPVILMNDDSARVIQHCCIRITSGAHT